MSVISDSSLFGQVTVMGKSEQSPVEAKEKGSEMVKSTLKSKKNTKNKNNENNQQNKKHEKLCPPKIENESQVSEPGKYLFLY